MTATGGRRAMWGVVVAFALIVLAELAALVAARRWDALPVVVAHACVAVLLAVVLWRTP